MSKSIPIARNAIAFCLKTKPSVFLLRVNSISHSSILLFECENWTLTADLERRVKTFENKCYRRMLGISYKEHITNEVNIFAGRQELLLPTVKHPKLSGSAMSAVTIRWQKSYYSEQWMVVVAEVDRVNRRRITSKNG